MCGSAENCGPEACTDELLMGCRLFCSGWSVFGPFWGGGAHCVFSWTVTQPSEQLVAKAHLGKSVVAYAHPTY